MNITIFNKKYWVRRFGPQEYVNGYAKNSYSHFVASLNVHPGSDQMNGLPEGERHLKRLEGHGTDLLIASDQRSDQKADLLWYHGAWYECTSAVMWDHTILNHWNYQFVEVPMDAASSIDTANPPTTDPNDYQAGYDCGGDCGACGLCERAI